MSDPEVTTQTEQTPPPGETGTLLTQETSPSKETKVEGEGDKTLLTQETKPKEGEAKPPVGAPEKYEPYKTPEGYTLNEDVAAEANGLFKELGLTQDQAQKAIDLYAKHALESFNSAQKSYKDMRADWVSKAKALPEIGTEIGAGKKVNVAISKAIDGLGDPSLAKDFRAAMDLTGAGDHPAFIQVMYRLASKLVEGGPVNGRGPSAHGQAAPGGGRKTAAQEMYPNLPSGA